RRARDRPCGAAGAGPEPAAGGRATAPGDQAAGRPSRRPRRPASTNPAAAALAPVSARPNLRCAAADARPLLASRPRRPLAGPPRAGAAGAARARARLDLPLADPRSPNSTTSSSLRVRQTAPALLELPGCAAVTAAKLLGEIGPIDRFNSDAQLARHSGVAPLEASSGRSQRHRLDRGGNRQLNAALYRIAITQARYHPAACAYLERKQAEGESKREAI